MSTTATTTAAAAAVTATATAKPVPTGSVTTIVHFTDGAKSKQAFYLKLEKSSLDDEILSDLRANIAGLTGSIEISQYPFCGKKGAIVPDSFKIEEYLSECLEIDTTNAKTLDVYMKDEAAASRQEDLVGAKGAGISSYLDADKVARIKSQVDDVAFKFITGTAAKYVPELEQRDWAVINDSNALCYGLRVIRVVGTEALPEGADPRGTPVGIERARSPAFRLKRRTILSDSLPSSTIDGVKLELRIPDFIIDDKSYVSIYETQTDMQVSMATSSFSEVDVAAAGSGSYMGFSGSASMSFAMTSSQAATRSGSKKSKKVTIAYNFPRVTVFLDSRSLELTPECDAALRKIKTKADAYAFQDIFGEFFSSRVQLGGRLFSTEEVTGTSDASTSEKVRSMKAAASASFSGWGSEASLSASAATKGSDSNQASSSASTSSLTWQANGGDTLLCNKPSDWAPTVSYHWNWRVTKQDNVATMFDVASQLDGMSWLVAKAKEWGFVVNPRATLDSPRQAAARPKRPITLNQLNVVGGRYLLAFTPSSSSLGDTAKSLNSKLNVTFSIDATVTSKAAAALGPKTAQSTQYQRTWELEDESGALVEEIKWNTKYRLANRSVGGYLDYSVIQGWHFARINFDRATSRFITFQDEKGVSTSVNVIPSGSTVIIRYWDPESGGKLGYLDLIYKAADTENGYLTVAPADRAIKEADICKLVLTYV